MPLRSKLILFRRLSSLRVSQGLTQEAFAEKAGISYKYYQAIEEGRRSDLRLSTLLRLAEAHSITISEMIGESPRPAKTAKKAPAHTKRKLKKKA